jgi:L-threonylcarbamoyladenylate synthase
MMVSRDISALDSADPSWREELAEAAAALRAGKLVVFPTETFYALGADPRQPEALAAIVRVKGREPDKPIALIAADNASAFSISRETPAAASFLAQAFWPGPLTLVLPARHRLNEVLIGPGGGVGVRISPHPIARALAAAVDFAEASPYPDPKDLLVDMFAD